MEILKHGDKFIIFNCPICKCKFKAYPSEYSYYNNNIDPPLFIIKCPDCKTEISQEVNNNE